MVPVNDLDRPLSHHESMIFQPVTPMHHPMTMVSSAASGLLRQPPVWRLPRRLRAAVMPSITCGYMSTAGRSRIQSGLASKPATLGRAAQPPRGAARHGSSMVRPRHLTCASSRRSRTSRDAREQEDAFGCAQLHAELSGHACALGVRLDLGRPVGMAGGAGPTQNCGRSGSGLGAPRLTAPPRTLGGGSRTTRARAYRPREWRAMPRGFSDAAV